MSNAATPISRSQVCPTAEHEALCATREGYDAITTRQRAWYEPEYSINQIVGECTVNGCGSTLSFDLDPEATAAAELAFEPEQVAL